MAIASLAPASFTPLKSRFSTIRVGLKKATTDLGRSSKLLFRKTRIKAESIRLRKSFFARREEGVRRREKEGQLEAAKIGTGRRRGGNPLGDLGKGLLEKIMDTLGTFLVGWLVYNLPTIMTMAQNLIGRIKTAGNIITGFFGNVLKVFTGAGNIAGAIMQNIVSLDIFDNSKRVRTAFGGLNNTFSDMQDEIIRGVKLFTTPLGELPDEIAVPKTGTDYTTPAGGKSRMTGPMKEALDVIASHESESAGGYNAMNQGTVSDSKGNRPRSGPSSGIIGKNLTNMTIGEVIAHQNKRLTNDKGFIHAAGRYQFIGNTLPSAMTAAGLKPGDPFSPENQDLMAATLLKSRGISPWTADPRSGYNARERAIIERGRKSQVQYSSVATTQAEPNAPQPIGQSSGGKIIEYLTGDRKHKRYRADHAAGNYHDHIAFDNQATRDAAIRWLQGKGWTVGSINTGRHAEGSYHYSNQAFDIPFYPNQSRKGVTDDAKGESTLSSRLRADLIAGGFSGPQLGGVSPSNIEVPSLSPEDISSQPGQLQAESLPPVEPITSVLFIDDRPDSPQMPDVGGGNKPPMAPPATVNQATLLNNFIKTVILSDLAYT